MSATIAFDLDGTLVDTAPDLIGALNHTLAAEGLAEIPLESARDLIGAGALALVRRGMSLHGQAPDEARLAAAHARFLAYYEEHIADVSRAFPGVEAALDTLATAGYRLAVCTNKPERLSHLLLRRLDLSRYFASVGGGDSFPVRKPEAAHLLGTIAAAGGAGGPAVMIGDSITDRDAARNAGVPVALVTFGYTPIPARELGADALVDHFDEVPAAVAALLARTPAIP